MRFLQAVLLVATVGVPTLVALVLQARPAPPKSPETQALGELVYRRGTFSLRLTNRPCPVDEFVLELESEGVPPALAFVTTQGDRRHLGCWAKDIGGDVMTRQAGAEPGTIPIDWFQRDIEL
jgi:hypothetical protein